MPLNPAHPQSSVTVNDSCRDACATCAQVCEEMIFRHCLISGGSHAAPEHLRLMADCVDICRTAATFMTRGSPFHVRVCAACAEVCRACAASCRGLSGMQSCVAACERCEVSCAEMARMA